MANLSDYFGPVGATAEAHDIKTGLTAYINSGKVTGTGYFPAMMDFDGSTGYFSLTAAFKCVGGMDGHRSIQVGIADALTGIMDEHCAFRDSRALTDVFGFEAAKGRSENVVAGKGRELIRLTAARAMASEEGAPVLLANRFGGGRAYYLNYFLNTYPEDRREGRTGDALKNLKTILVDAGIYPKVRMLGEDGTPVGGCAGYLYNNGSTRLIGLLPDKSRSGPQQIRLFLAGRLPSTMSGRSSTWAPQPISRRISNLRFPACSHWWRTGSPGSMQKGPRK